MATRDLQAEQRAMKDLMGTGQYKLEGGKSSQLEGDIRKKVYGSKRPTFRSKYGLDKMEQEIDKATSQTESRAAGQGRTGRYYEGQLRKAMPWLGSSRQDLQKQYGKGGSEEITDPFARERAVQSGMESGRASLGEIMSRMMGLYQSKTAEGEAGVRNKEREYARAMQKYQEDLAQSQVLDQQEAAEAQQAFENQLALMKSQGGSSGGRSSGGRRSGGGRKGGGGGKTSKAERIADIYNDKRIQSWDDPAVFGQGVAKQQLNELMKTSPEYSQELIYRYGEAEKKYNKADHKELPPKEQEGTNEKAWWKFWD